MTAVSQHQEAERPDEGGDQQGQENIPPTAFWKEETRNELTTLS